MIYDILIGYCIMSYIFMSVLYLVSKRSFKEWTDFVILIFSPLSFIALIIFMMVGTNEEKDIQSKDDSVS